MSMRVIKVCILLMAAAGTSLAQSSYSTGAAEYGGLLFIDNCAFCHGPDGDSVAGVDLGHGKFRQALSDDDLVQIISTGVSGTSMPGFSNEFSEIDTRMVVAYLRYMASTAQSTSVPGDAVQGKVIFEGKGECLNCHRVREKGSRVGPDLSEIGTVRRLIELERSVLEPGVAVLPQNRYVRVVTRDGATIIGRLLNQDTFTVQLIDSTERLHSFQKSVLKEYGLIDKPSMPSYQRKLSARELADLVSYLASLK